VSYEQPLAKFAGEGEVDGSTSRAVLDALPEHLICHCHATESANGTTTVVVWVLVDWSRQQSMRTILTRGNQRQSRK